MREIPLPCSRTHLHGGLGLQGVIPTAIIAVVPSAVFGGLWLPRAVASQ